MQSYEELKMSVVVFEQTDIVRTSSEDNIGGVGDDWEG